MPKVLHVNYSSCGGAGVACQRTSDEIATTSGWQSDTFFAVNESLWVRPFSDLLATITAAFDNFIVRKPESVSPLSLFRRSAHAGRLARQIGAGGYDVIHLHWVEGLLTPRVVSAILRSGARVVVTLHDMRPLTGACHHSGGCEQYLSGCGSCPLARGAFHSSIRKSQARRRELICTLAPRLIAPGQWMMHRIPDEFKPDSVLIANPMPKVLGKRDRVRNEGPLRVGFLAANLQDPIKNLTATRKHVEGLRAQGLNAVLALAGGSCPKDLKPWETHVGLLSENQKWAWLGSLDFLSFTSVHDNAPLVVQEALTCGTPVLYEIGTGADEQLEASPNSIRWTNFNASSHGWLTRTGQEKQRLSRENQSPEQGYSYAQLAYQLDGSA